MTLLSVERLRVSFGGREVGHRLEFELRAEEKLALVGESGSGKPVRSSQATASRQACWRPMARLSSSTSAIWSPTVKRGLSAVMGS